MVDIPFWGEFGREFIREYIVEFVKERFHVGVTSIGVNKTFFGYLTDEYYVISVPGLVQLLVGNHSDGWKILSLVQVGDG